MYYCLFFALFWLSYLTFNFNFCFKHWLRSFKTMRLFDSNLRTTVPFLTAHLEIFHCMHHPVIPNSDLYFTFSSTLNALSKRTSKKLLMAYSITSRNGVNPSKPLNRCNINICFCFVQHINAFMY